MILHLWAATDATGYAIFDPTALRPNTGELVEEAFEAILAENEAGTLILYSDASYGAVTLRVYVDEDPGDELRLRAINAARDGVCRFPGGRITLTGVEEIERAGQQPSGVSPPARVRSGSPTHVIHTGRRRTDDDPAGVDPHDSAVGRRTGRDADRPQLAAR